MKEGVQKFKIRKYVQKVYINLNEGHSIEWLFVFC